MEFTIQKNTPVKPHKKHWQFCVGSGHAQLPLEDELDVNDVYFFEIKM